MNSRQRKKQRDFSRRMLLEAAAFIQEKADRYPDTLGSYYHINDADELRRMAESTKGEKE